jgi:membrane-bound serine protease (ClpP class)
MVDPRTFIAGINDTGKVLTLTTDEAIKYGYCEGEAENIPEVLKLAGIEKSKTVEFKVSSLEAVIGFFMNPIVQSILIMLIVAGVYFELQHPGIGLPLFLALSAAALYFAPLYLEGLAQNWEIILFIIGLILLALEIFVIPGFGVAGISGIALIITGLALSMVDNVNFRFDKEHVVPVLQSLLMVVFSALFSAVLSIFLSSILLSSARSPLRGLVLSTTQQIKEGYISVEPEYASHIGEKGTTLTILRPAGKIIINDKVYDAKCETGYIEKNVEVIVSGFDAGQLCVRKFEL